jgi:putative CocE/NonD family hydrolase
VLTWQTAPLTEAVTIAGDVTAHLCASTTGGDADWVVKLIDVYPDSVAGDPRMGGYELMVAEDIMRGRYRSGFDRPAAITPNSVQEFPVNLHEQLYRFLPGHRIMVQVQSSWFPLYDRNPQTYVPNIFDAKPSDFHAEEHRVYHGGPCASRIELGVM